MCGRSSISLKEDGLKKPIEDQLGKLKFGPPKEFPLFNIYPSMETPIILDSEPDKIQMISWGLIPSWATDVKKTPPQINARIESVLEKPYFRKSIQTNRCLVLLTGYFEWKQVNKHTKIPYYIHLKDQAPFAVAGIWDIHNGKKTYSLLTQSPNESLATVHDRMPGILLPEQYAPWLDKTKTGEEVISMVRPYPKELMQFHTVSMRLNSVFDNDPTLLLPVAFESIPQQTSLF
ncbi:MAG: SOS response-associated peptidase [Cytophagales bacterium]|nr:SOS response-associated peptidase [Cytophagales bacterium]